MIFDLVDRVIGEQGVVPISSSGRQGPVAGDEHPVIGIADDGHEEVRHLIVVAYLVETFALDLRKAPFDGSFSSIQAGITQKNLVVCHMSKHFRDVRIGMSYSIVSAYIRLDVCLTKVNRFVHEFAVLRGASIVAPRKWSLKDRADYH